MSDGQADDDVEMEDLEDEDLDEEDLDGLADARCPSCGHTGDHTVLRVRARGQGEDVLVQCHACQHVHDVELRPPPAVQLRTILSWGEESQRIVLNLDADERLAVGDEFEHEDATWRVSRLEFPNGASRKRARADAIGTLWAVRSDLVRVHLTMTENNRSTSDVIIAEPTDVFTAGSIIQHEGVRWRIRAIHTGRGRTMSGKVEAAEVRRLYLHPPPERAPRQDEERPRRRWD